MRKELPQRRQAATGAQTVPSWGRRVRSALAWRSLALVALGGFCGTLLRFSLDLIAQNYPLTALHFSWSTWMVNLLGATLLGYLGRVLARLRRGRPSAIPDRIRLLTATGFCGSLTTYGTVAGVGARTLPGPGFSDVWGRFVGDGPFPWGINLPLAPFLPTLFEALAMVVLGLLCAYLGVLLGGIGAAKEGGQS